MSNHYPLKDFSNPRNPYAYAAQAGLGLVALAMTTSVLCANRWLPPARAATIVLNSVAVTSVSAASFAGPPAPLATESIAAAFGTQLATGTLAANSQPLPTSLSGTTVTLNGVAAPLFFVSPNQVNYLVPSNLPPGRVQVVITLTQANGDQIVSRGEATITQSSPAIFTANANGQGVPAAVTGRINAQGQFAFDPVLPFEAAPLQPGQMIPRPIDVGSNEQPAFLIIYGTGIRHAPPGSVRAIIGGIEVSDPVSIPAPGFAGLDQVNIRIPPALRGSGIVDVALSVDGVASNAVKMNLMGATIGPMAITGFSAMGPVLAGQTISIQGSGFAPTSDQNIVRIGPAKARVTAAASNQLTVIVPFGAESDRVIVQTLQNEVRSNAVLQVRTSLSGIIQSTGSPSSPPVPLSGATVRLVGANISVRTNAQGTFIISDPPTGIAQLEIEGGTVRSDPPFPQITLKATIHPNRDNQFEQAISLQQISGGSAVVGNDPVAAINSLSAANSVRAPGSFRRKDSSMGLNSDVVSRLSSSSVSISDRGVSLDVPFGTSVSFPDGRTSGRIQLTVLEKSRLPGINLPNGVFSPNIAQITPLGTRFTPGASLRFPNPDPANLAPGTKLDLYRYDPSPGIFVKRGTGTVSPDRTQVITDERIIDLATFWLVATPGGVTTVTGQVVDETGRPVPGTIVSVNGRSDFTDLNGGFSILDVSTGGVTTIQVDAFLPLQSGILPRGSSAPTTPTSGGVTNVGVVQLNGANRPSLILSPFAINLASNSSPVKVDVIITQPAPAGGLPITLSSGDPGIVSVPGSIMIPAGLTSTSFNLTRNRSGATTIFARATIAGLAIEGSASISVAASAPVLSAVIPSSGPPGVKIAISGTGLSAIPIYNSVALFRGGNYAEVLDRTKNQVSIDQAGKISLIVEVPPSSPGPVGILVSVLDDATRTFSDIGGPLIFDVLASNVVAPRLTAVTPASGMPRDIVRIDGAGFGPTVDENRVFFRQEYGDMQARIIDVTPSSLTVEVPSLAIKAGPAIIIARRASPDGAISEVSNALDFTISAVLNAPPTPTLTQVVTAENLSAGRDGDVIFATGTGFGTGLPSDIPFMADPLISLLIFSQVNIPVTAVLPLDASLGTRLTSVVPTGLVQGPARVTAVTFDRATGAVSDESNPVSFLITTDRLTRLNEIEPNDQPETAQPISLQTLISGRASRDDPSGFMAFFSDGTSEPLPDLYRLSVGTTTNISLQLDFTQSADLDLILGSAIPSDDGSYQFYIVSANSTGTVEEFTAQFPPGEYLIFIGAFSGTSNYGLTIAQAYTDMPAAASALGPNRSGLSEPEKMTGRGRILRVGAGSNK